MFIRSDQIRSFVTLFPQSKCSAPVSCTLNELNKKSLSCLSIEPKGKKLKGKDREFSSLSDFERDNTGDEGSEEDSDSEEEECREKRVFKPKGVFELIESEIENPNYPSGECALC